MVRSTRPAIAAIGPARRRRLRGGAVPAPSPRPPRAGASDAAPRAAPPQRPAPSPIAAVPARLTVANLDKPLLPGTYRVAGPFGAAFSLEFPTEWTLKSLDEGDVEFVNSGKGDNGVAWLVIDTVENVFADPCHATGPSDPPVAKTVDQVVEALTRMTG